MNKVILSGSIWGLKQVESKTQKGKTIASFYISNFDNTWKFWIPCNSFDEAISKQLFTEGKKVGDITDDKKGVSLPGMYEIEGSLQLWVVGKNQYRKIVVTSLKKLD